MSYKCIRYKIDNSNIFNSIYFQNIEYLLFKIHMRYFTENNCFVRTILFGLYLLLRN